MIRSRNPKIDVAALEAKVAADLAADPQAATDGRIMRLTATVHLRTIENALERAEERSAARTRWPDDIGGILRSSPLLQRVILRVIGLLFRDQHDVNAQLIRAHRETLVLTHGLIERIDILEARLEAERASARADRLARRYEPD
jgi:hypothetical protein